MTPREREAKALAARLAARLGTTRPATKATQPGTKAPGSEADTFAAGGDKPMRFPFPTR